MSAQERLERLLKSGQIPHALLFSGPKGAGKKQVAIDFAVQLLQTKKNPENHPDIHRYFPEGKTGMHPIAAIRALTQEVALAPYEGKWKVFIIYEAEKMLPTSGNALLKTLEEPFPHTLILLISDHADRLLPTILSRCQTLYFPPVKNAEPHEAILSFLAGESGHEKLAKIEDSRPDAIFETILFWYRDRMLLDLKGCEEYLHFPRHIKALQKTPLISLEEVEKGVAQARLAFERSTKLSTCLEMLFLYLETRAPSYLNG